MVRFINSPVLVSASWPGLSRPSPSCLVNCRKKTWMPATRAGMTKRESKFAQQPAKSLDAIVDATAAQRVPDDRLERRHHGDAELALERLDRAGGRPVRRRQQNRVGVGMRALELAAHLERRILRDAADLVEGAAPAGRSQHLAAEKIGR